MANTLVELEKLSTDKLKKGVMKTIIYESPFASRLPFITIEGNALKYNLEETEAGADWYTVGDTWAESTPTWDQRSVDLSVLGGDADIDSFIQQTRKDQDVGAAIVELKSKAIAYEFDKQAILGRTTSHADAKSMKGLMLLCAECESSSTTDWDAPNNSQLYSPSNASATLALADIDYLIDLIKPGTPNALLVSRRARRKITALARASGSVMRETHDDLGRPVAHYADIPLIVSDRVPCNFDDSTTGVVTLTSYDDTTACGTGGSDNHVIFAVRFGEDGLCGIQNLGIQTENLGQLETKDASRVRIKWYCGLANFATKSIAALFDVTD